MRSPLLALLILAVSVAPAIAQVQGGNISGTIQDAQGGVLPGAMVKISGSDRTAEFTTGSDGRYRFLNLPPGSYTLTVTLPGFTTVTHENVVVTVGQNVDLAVTLQLASVEQSITVTGESPIIDTKQMGTATNFTQQELASIPTSRDPWALLRTVPGVMVDRVNIAGNETGQQSNFQSKGTRPADAVWTMDGVPITDMAAIGASPTYFNYDNFEEIQVSTSGQDIRQSTGGIGLNFVVKRGTNQLHGGVRGYFTNDALESSNLTDEHRAQGITSKSLADHNEQISDYGFDLGGPIVRDRAWVYGSWSKQDIRLFRRASGLDTTDLTTWNIKGNWQATKDDMISVLWFLGEKDKTGRSPGTSGILFEPQSATWNQGGAYEEGKPWGLLKIEDNRTFGSSVFVSARYAYYNTGFGLFPQGGLDMQAGESQILNSSFGSTRQSTFLRPQHTVAVDGSIFKTFLGAAHDLKAGGGWRRADATTNTIWPGNMILALANSTTDFRARVYREGLGTNRTEFFHLYLGDTVSAGPITVDAGIRYDRQWGSALPSSTRSNGAFPELVPGIQFAGYDAPFTWNNVSPRVGLTYAVDESRKTIVRASFSRYAGQLETGVIGFSNPSGSVGFADYPWQDLNGDHLAQPNEVNVNVAPITFGGGFNPANPTSVVSADVIDPNLKAPVTSSVVVGVDRELMANLAVQVNYSYSRTSNYYGTGNSTAYFAPWVGVTAADYFQSGTLSGTIPGTDISYDIPLFSPDPAVVAANGNSRMLTNWPGYKSYYHGVEFSLVKRMSNRWMARIAAAYNEPRETYGSSLVNDSGNPTRTDINPLVNGGSYVIRSSGSGSGDIFIASKWQVNANGVYIFPYDIEVGANLFGRQGYPFPVYRTGALGLDGSYRVLLTPEINTLRLDNLWNLDLRVARTFRVDRIDAELIGDLFNVFNSSTELVRVRNAAAPNFRQLAQNLSPRIVRFGVRIGF